MMLWTLATMLYQLRLSLLVVAEYEEVGGSDVTDIANGEDNRLANVNWRRRYRPSHHPLPPGHHVEGGRRGRGANVSGD